jgi:hypothetical protein
MLSNYPFLSYIGYTSLVAVVGDISDISTATSDVMSSPNESFGGYNTSAVSSNCIDDLAKKFLYHYFRIPL